MSDLQHGCTSLAGSSLALLVAVAGAQPKPRLELCNAVRYLLFASRLRAAILQAPGTWPAGGERLTPTRCRAARVLSVSQPGQASVPAAGDPISKFPSPATADTCSTLNTALLCQHAITTSLHNLP